MILLQDILYKVPLLKIIGNTQVPVTGVCISTSDVVYGCTFIAIVGSVTDGHLYITQAINAGATVIVCNTLPAELLPSITYILTKDTSYAAGLMAHAYYNQPSTKLLLVGVTGTNGKTTVATLLHQLYTAMGYTCGLVSTVQNIIGTTIQVSTHTTPNAVVLNKLLAQMLEQGCTHVFIEVSSHAIHQHRIAGLQFAAAIFTNITHDHLDYHLTFNEYIRVKKMLFDNLSSNAFAIVNIDDKKGMVMLTNTKAIQVTYSLNTIANYRAKMLDNALTGLQLNINNTEVHCRLIGLFNAYNLLAVYATAVSLGEQEAPILQALSNLPGAIGRFDCNITPVQKIIGIIDYAHTPDALQNVLATILNLNYTNSKIITVVGCGGNRDKTKRPLMAAVACAYSTNVILTADNPRTEPVEAIIDDMVTDIKPAYKRKYSVIPNRYEAIKMALTLAGQGDIILVAGKGHETYQEINGVKNDFDDKKIFNKIVKLLNK